MLVDPPHLSVVSPVYCCDNCLVELYSRVVAAASRVSEHFELILVCDNSPDNSWATIQGLARSDNRVRGILLSRNFGQHYAITAGLDSARGDWVVVMDCDLQDRPEEIPTLYAAAQEGFDIVFGAREERRDSAMKRFGSRLFYRVLNYLSDANHDSRTANFGIYHRKVIDVLRAMREPKRAFPIQVKWTGFRQHAITVQHDERAEGKSSYTLGKLLKLAIDITLSYSDKPLRLSAYIGFLLAATSGVYAVVLFVRYLLGEVLVLGYTSLIVSIWLLGGIILFCVGVLGLYLGRVYEGTKGRPIYIVATRTDDDPDPTVPSSPRRHPTSSGSE